MAWKRGLAVSCSHGQYADPASLNEVIRFKKAWNPHVTLHLGDALDFTAFRAGAKGTKDEAAKIELDFAAGTRFLERLEPTHFFMGNHEDRITKLLDHPNAITSYAASKVMGEISDLCRKMHARVVPYDNEEGWVKFGDTRFGHGFMFNEMGIRDHAEAYGKCVIGHLHTPGMAHGRTLDPSVCYCVGWLGRNQMASYAKTNKSRHKWNNGYVWFEYNDQATVIRLEEKHPTAGWRCAL